MVSAQRHVGEVHARAQIPVNLVARGLRLLKHEINTRLLEILNESDMRSLRFFKEWAKAT
mgnify:CR=1 FL=1